MRASVHFRPALLFSAAAIYFVGAAFGAPQKPSPQTKTVTDQDNEGAITLNSGDTLLVRLKANPTTGYTWNIVADPGLPLNLAGNPQYTTDKHPAGFVGAGGTEEFHFAVTGGASYDRAGYLRMLSLRPWEPGVKDAKLWEIKVTIKGTR